jgi:hypothetical protein
MIAGHIMILRQNSLISLVLLELLRSPNWNLGMRFGRKERKGRGEMTEHNLWLRMSLGEKKNAKFRLALLRQRLVLETSSGSKLQALKIVSVSPLLD